MSPTRSIFTILVLSGLSLSAYADNVVRTSFRGVALDMTQEQVASSIDRELTVEPRDWAQWVKNPEDMERLHLNGMYFNRGQNRCGLASTEKGRIP
jgi:hypothetical protein